METQQDDICCLNNEESQSSPDVLCAETGKTIQIRVDSQCIPVEMTICETKSSETDENISCKKKNKKQRGGENDCP